MDGRMDVMLYDGGMRDNDLMMSMMSVTLVVLP
jgi:hypothetical protein